MKMDEKAIDTTYKMYLDSIRKVSRHLHDNTDIAGNQAVAGLLLAVCDELISIGGEKATKQLLSAAADVIDTINLKVHH